MTTREVLYQSNVQLLRIGRNINQIAKSLNTKLQLFTSSDDQAHLEVTLEKDTVWLSQAQMGQLFDTSTDNISLHLKNIYVDQELAESATTEDFSVVQGYTFNQQLLKLANKKLLKNQKSIPIGIPTTSKWTRYNETRLYAA